MAITISLLSITVKNNENRLIFGEVTDKSIVSFCLPHDSAIHRRQSQKQETTFLHMTSPEYNMHLAQSTVPLSNAPIG